LWIEHAERNAIYNAARAGTGLEGCTLYAGLTPCMDCARAIVQAGIVEVVLDEERVKKYSSEQYNPHFALVHELFREAGVTMRHVTL
jgi:dCMP deaminase